MLYCKKLDEKAVLPTVAHAGEDLAFDFYSLQPVVLYSNMVTKVRTGISARFIDDNAHYDSLGGYGTKIENVFGLLLRDRSSMAANGITVSAGVIDAGYSNEILVLLTNHSNEPYFINEGDKIIQALPIQVMTGCGVKEVNELPNSNRGLKGFG